ncbi:hypothetical protein Tco_0126536 [Tanacetum coccineum]
MADNRTMAQLLEAPTEGYEDAIVIPEITANNFEIKHELKSRAFSKNLMSSFYEAWDRFNDILRDALHQEFSELHQVDTFYNSSNSIDQDYLNSAAVAAAANFNQANSGYRPPMVSNQIRPPGFPPIQNPHANNQNNFNRGNNFNQNRGNNFNQGQIYRPPVNQPVAHQGPAPQTHGVSKTDFERLLSQQ